jgi:DNA-binding transcriptional ArsR family regulator
MLTQPADLVAWLRAAGERSRLRLLALCAEGAFCVSDLAQALRQSEARVSRHLKILCEAGLLERLREGQWVQYRLADTPEAASFVRGLLGQLDRRDSELQRDAAAARASAAAATHASAVTGESRLGRALAGFLGAGAFAPASGAPIGEVLVVGVTHPELLECAARAARRCTALAPSRRAAQGARAFAGRRGFACGVLQAARPGTPGAADLARAGSSFEAVLLDHPPADTDTLARLLDEARQVLRPGGRLWIFEPYEALESARGRIVEHPLARLRRLLGAAGFVCERLSPFEADGAHVLAAAASVAAAGSGAGAAPADSRAGASTAGRST